MERGEPSGSRTLRVLIGENRELADYFSACVKAAVGAESTFSVQFCPPRSDDILRHCRAAAFDLVILVLNNIVFPEIGIGTRQTRSERWLRFIAEVKSVSSCPIIACCGWFEGDPLLDTLHVTDAVAAGARFVFRLPAPTAEIIGAVSKCLFDEARSHPSAS